MRFFSSSALASAPKLRLAASCSAAETMLDFLPPPFAPSCPRPGHSADAGHYLVLGFDKSIVPHAQRPARCGPMTQMLRCLAFFLGGREDLHRAAGLLNRRDRGLRGAMHLDVELGLELAAAEQPHAGLG